MKPPISLERYRMCVRHIYQALKDSDGMTAHELEKLTGFPRSTIMLALNDNLLFYVDRWKLTNRVCPTQVWMNSDVTQHEDCPRPDQLEAA